MRFTNLALIAMAAIPLSLSVGCTDGGSSSGTAGGGGAGGEGGTGGDILREPYAASVCVGAKQAAASTFCQSLFDAWVTWESDQDTGARNAAAEAARTVLATAWDAAEAGAANGGADCSDLALASSDAAEGMEAGIDGIAAAINDGLDLGQSEQAQCGADLLTAAGVACEGVLAAESEHISNLHADSDSSILDAAKGAAFDAFSSAWADATSGNCPTAATDAETRGAVESLAGELVFDTIVTPLLDDQAYTTLTPGETDYLGRTYMPQCMQGDEYVYYAKRGSVNKLLMYYQGGGACWDNLTCSLPTCRTSPPDVPVIDSSGFGDLTNANNPFRDWNVVFVSYCTCDIHFGDASVEYVGLENLTVEHRGYHNSKVAERWAREHFLNPEEVFVTGSSAGAYGAWFNGPLLHEVWPASQMHVLADAGNGVITADFLQNEFGNWNFVANLPDIPGVLESITGGDGIPGYTEAIATHFPDTNWAHYSTMFDGGRGGQTGFYNIMLSDGNPLAASVWWQATCQFGQNARTQSETISDAVPSNYRYYFGTGSRHTMWGSNKVYDDTTGGVPTIVDWIDAMLASSPESRDPDWKNVQCENCGLTLDGDPRPEPLEAPFEQQGGDVVIVCP